MEFFKGIFGKGSEKVKPEGRESDGGNFMAVPPKPPGDISDEEVLMLKNRREKIESLATKIAEIEGDLNHPDQDKLEELRKELRSIS